MIANLKPLIEDPGFTPEAVKKASVACMAMCMWARAMDTYNRVVLVVEPKKALLAEAQVELDVRMFVGTRKIDQTSNEHKSYE